MMEIVDLGSSFLFILVEYFSGMDEPQYKTRGWNWNSGNEMHLVFSNEGQGKLSTT